MRYSVVPASGSGSFVGLPFFGLWPLPFGLVLGFWFLVYWGALALALAFAADTTRTGV
jgi:hypothetical protein